MIGDGMQMTPSNVSRMPPERIRSTSGTTPEGSSTNKGLLSVYLRYVLASEWPHRGSHHTSFINKTPLNKFY